MSKFSIFCTFTGWIAEMLFMLFSACIYCCVMGQTQLKIKHASLWAFHLRHVLVILILKQYAQSKLKK